MKKRGEITVFLSLTIVCVMSLLTGILESARTAGARLYLQMASNSAMSSVMSQYNRNLWDMYHLLFLESESENAVLEVFETYLNYYLEQENWYPMKLSDTEVTEFLSMSENGGRALEEEILSYAEYCLPEIVGDLLGDSDEVLEAEKAGDFRYLFAVCSQAGKKTQKLEKQRKKIEKSLADMNDLLDETKEKASEESRSGTKKKARALIKEIDKFPKLVDAYEKECEKISAYREELASSDHSDIKDSDTSENLNQELLAYEQVDEAAKTQLSDYREIENTLKSICNDMETVVDELQTDEPDWAAVGDLLDGTEILEGEKESEEDEEKMSEIESLEVLFAGELLTLVIPAERQVSDKSVSLKNIPSEVLKTESETETEELLEKTMIDEYCFLYFDSFLEKNGHGTEYEKKPLLYEQEYLLCGEKSDRENLKETAEKLFALRGAVNLMYLLTTPEKKAEADSLAAVISGGNVPVQLVLSFFIMTLWAFGEAVWDVRCLLAGGGVPFFKTQTTWKLDLEGLLTLKFLEHADLNRQEGKKYREYLRILLFLTDREVRNYRIMDLMQWNVRTVQNDFAAADCIHELKIRAEVLNRHVFAMKSEYMRSTEVKGGY